MYTRNTYRTQRNDSQRYTPPPGYVGNAFSGKHHVPEQNIRDNVPRRPQEDSREAQISEEGIRAENIPLRENALNCRGEEENRDNNGSHELQQEGEVPKVPGPAEKSPLQDLLGHLRGKIGTEELIILLIMLLISSDGIGAEALVLGLVLLAGG